MHIRYDIVFTPRLKAKLAYRIDPIPQPLQSELKFVQIGDYMQLYGSKLSTQVILREWIWEADSLTLRIALDDPSSELPLLAN